MTRELKNKHFSTFTMVKEWNYLTKIILFSYLAVYQCQALNAPTIDLHPKAEVAYRAESEILVECAANPTSNSEYKWKKNGVEYPVPNRGPISFLDPGRLGTIRFTKPTEQDEGEYQCFATNEFGTAVSTRAVLKKAFFDPFKTVTGPEIKNPTVGNSETLKCSPPASYPKDTPYWGIGRPNDKKYQNLNTSERIQVDYDGNLHFANIREDDFLTMERFYTCIVYNSELRASVAGNDVKIFPQSVSGNLRFANIIMSDAMTDATNGDFEYICILPIVALSAQAHGSNHKIVPEKPQGDIPRQAPSLLWSSPKSDRAVKGHDKKLKCIFGGYPTPRVTWRRKNGEKNSRMQETQDGHGTELLISNTQESDAGEYICTATAGQSSESATINLRIESPPFWNQGKSPANVEVEEDGEATFNCEAYGYPRPKIEWGINGVNIDKLGSDSRRRLEGNTLTFTDLKKGDNKVIQCVATNEHGTILANAYLIVISAPPSFTRTPNDTTVVQGRKAKLECLAYGAPKPEIKWKKGNPPEEVRNDGWNYIIHTNGTLEILRAERHDEGDYFCIAKNRHDETQAKARINVRQPTTISTPKSEEKVNRTEDATLQCDANTDPAERSNLKVVWLKNDEPIDYNKDRHLTYNSQTFSLTIKRSMVKDTAVYKCNASNGLDSAESGPINLIVRDRPEPPTDITIDSCTAEYSDISFLPGSDNNDPIKQFTVYYSVDSEPDMVISKVILPPHSGKFDPKQRVGGNDGRLNLTPWRNYTFYVAAENSLGASEPSTSSSSVCRTQAARPTKNPENVCSRLQGTEQLIITWSPVAREHHHGSDYRYVVGYRPFRSHDSMKEIRIFKSEQSELVIHDMPEFKRYEVTVWAENKEGATTRTGRQTKAVYSSEGKPLDSPRNFKVGYYNGTYGEFSWDPVDTRSERVKGFFRGYRIKFWKTDDPNNFRVEDILIDDKEIDLCPDVSEIISYRRKRQSSRNSGRGGSTHKLWPFSKITAGVSVLNSAHSGDLSDTIEFITPEGPPEAVKDLDITEVGSSHLIATWSLPTSSNGVVTSFILEYQVDPQQVGILRKEIINDPNIMTRKIMGLQPDTMYRVTLYAVTTAGPGQAMFKDATTLSDTQPDKPRISKVEAGEDSANVTFDATDKPPKQNPGSRFYVEYAKEGPGHTWNKTDLDPHSPENWVHVDKLEPGTYFFRVVAVNGRHGHEKETRSDTMTIEIGERRDYEVSTPRHDAQIQLAGASAGWFIVLMCIIVLLLIILLIICCIKRSKGDMYPVYEKEKMLGRDPFAPDDAPFGEYNSSGRPDRSRSQGSLDSDDKPMESDTDSLGEYEDQDASKFNEDGSFIGLYGGKGRPKPEPTGPSVNTFV